jgi:SAM-dependent methyltransferase
LYADARKTTARQWAWTFRPLSEGVGAMVSDPQIDEDAFRSFERARHDSLAVSYHDFFAPITALAIEPLLTAAHVVPGCRLLDVACGSGVLTGHAAHRGAAAFGVDVAPRMIELARSLHTGIEFCEGDAEALPFEDSSFEAVACNFGIGHFPSAERAMTECTRVLRQRGHLAVSWWDLPSRARIQGLFVDALREVGATLPSDIPAGPPIFRYSEDSELRRLLERAGLVDVTIQQYSNTCRADSVDKMWVGSMGSLARTSAMVLAQTPEMQKRIRAAYDRLAETYTDERGLAVPISFKVAAGQRPG